ncbi:unnamed protein product [Bursaphelenchus okinawaensis]|uniref:Uncharacterized protein n=1 Tax=Bursaphelenchus okinawaensis TaxID=465554 RepID=A0A811LKK2_9BILA|nr:unnamed protein product [Bursaphelenchus okinawaensis]CAG9124784.1 unnamed protein product [Bursaphelenchus okinawaensis]
MWCLNTILDFLFFLWDLINQKLFGKSKKGKKKQRTEKKKEKTSDKEENVVKVDDKAPEKQPVRAISPNAPTVFEDINGAVKPALCNLGKKSKDKKKKLLAKKDKTQ